MWKCCVELSLGAVPAVVFSCSHLSVNLQLEHLKPKNSLWMSPCTSTTFFTGSCCHQVTPCRLQLTSKVWNKTLMPDAFLYESNVKIQWIKCMSQQEDNMTSGYIWLSTRNLGSFTWKCFLTWMQGSTVKGVHMTAGGHHFFSQVSRG